MSPNNGTLLYSYMALRRKGFVACGEVCFIHSMFLVKSSVMQQTNKCRFYGVVKTNEVYKIPGNIPKHVPGKWPGNLQRGIN